MRDNDTPAFILAELDDFGLTAVQFRVVCHIARRYNNEKRCAWPGRESMWKTCRIREETLDDAIHALASMRIITVEHVAGGANRYRFKQPSQWVKPTLPKPVGTPSNNSPQSERQEEPQTSGYPVPQTEMHLPPQSEGYKGIKEGNQIRKPKKGTNSEPVGSATVEDSLLTLEAADTPQPAVTPMPPAITAEQIYAVYPLKKGKLDALKAIAKAMTLATPEHLFMSAKAYADATNRWNDHDKKFIPHPATWFNKGNYDDDPSTWKRLYGVNPHRVPAPTAADHADESDSWGSVRV